MVGSKWMKLKQALGFNSCLYVPKTTDDSPAAVRKPTTPTPSSFGLRWPKLFSKSPTPEPENYCLICIQDMFPCQGLFTGECSHSFHYYCITLYMHQRKKICPMCNARWNKFPNSAADDSQYGVRRITIPRVEVNAPFNPVEPAVFDDDDEVYSRNQPYINSNISQSLEVKTFTEVSVVPKSQPYHDFNILIHLKAPTVNIDASRAPVDLVTVLDISGSMAGTKLALLKRAMGFVIQILGPTDRLSVIAFASASRRLFPLRRMTCSGKHEALQAVNSLCANGGTNIAEALRKGAKVMTDRKWKNPVSSVILLSDGRDMQAYRTPIESLLPVSMQHLHIPVHAFGFGVDHDAVRMHSISETSGGTFSFIETESVIQDAFAQCIGGLMSVVMQELKVEIECIDSTVKLTSIKSGNYKTVVASDKREGSIEVGDMYAEEERDFLVTTDIPICQSNNDMLSLMKVRCVYKNLISKNFVSQDLATDVKIHRALAVGKVVVSLEVDKQRNRLRSADAMAEARAAAEVGDLASAVLVLEKWRKELMQTASAKAGDRLCASLDVELKEMQERMANRRMYETLGRAYMLSGLSSHSWQRATARGDSTDSTSLLQAYQTPSMVDMVSMSQTMVFDNRPFGSTSPARFFPTIIYPR